MLYFLIVVAVLLLAYAGVLATRSPRWSCANWGCAAAGKVCRCCTS
nr:hypothetical protein [Micromonospora provocatoris]